MTHWNFPEFLVSQKKSSNFDKYLHFLVQNVHEQGVKKSETLPGIMRQRAEFGARASFLISSVAILYYCVETDSASI